MYFQLVYEFLLIRAEIFCQQVQRLLQRVVFYWATGSAFKVRIMHRWYGQLQTINGEFKGYYY